MLRQAKYFVVFLLSFLPLTSFAEYYESHMLISQAEQQWFTDLMQSNIPIDPNVYRGMPLAKIEGPTFENGVSAMFMVYKSDASDVYNIIAAPTFRNGAAYGAGIDLDDAEDFYVHNGFVFEAYGDIYRIVTHTYP